MKILRHAFDIDIRILRWLVIVAFSRLLIKIITKGKMLNTSLTFILLFTLLGSITGNFYSFILLSISNLLEVTTSFELFSQASCGSFTNCY